MEDWILISIGVAVATLSVLIIAWVTRRKKVGPAKAEAPAAGKAATEKAVEAPTPAGPPDLSKKLSRTRDFFSGRLAGLFGRSAGNELQAKEWESIEEGLIEADVGVTTTMQLIGKVKERLRASPTEDIRALVREECESLLAISEGELFAKKIDEKPYVISVVGINGVGKTTTIGKLAHLFKSSGKTVLLGAVDTFRAGAISQLKVWSERVGVQFVAGREGGDPGAVAFDSVNAGKARGIDIVLLDTAGRLHTKTNLMDELKKVHRVVKKVIPEAPHETWLVLDGTLGQNSITQAREFQKTLDLTGVIITKLDGTAKGGAILSVSSELKLPVKFIGVGEQMEDFVRFEPKQFVQAILGD